MKQKTKNILKIWLMAGALFCYGLAITPSLAQAAPNSILSGQICEPDNSTAGAGFNLARCVNNIYTFGVAIGGFVAVLMFVLSGYFYAQGGNENISKAKSYINSTIVGLVLLFGTYALLNTIDPNLTRIPKLTVPTDPCAEKNLVTQLGSYGTGGAACGDVSRGDATADIERAFTEAGTAIPNQVTRANDTRTPDANEGSISASNLFDNFSQLDGRWKDIPYTQKDGTPCSPADQSTIGTSGCGPSAMAMVLAYYSRHSKLKPTSQAPTVINPATIAFLSSKLGYRVCGSGTAYAMFPAVAQIYGIRATAARNWDEAKTALFQGYPVIAAMGPGYFTSNGHFVVLYGMADAAGNISTKTSSASGYGNDSGTNFTHVLISDSGPRRRTIAREQTVKDSQKYLIIIKP